MAYLYFYLTAIDGVIVRIIWQTIWRSSVTTMCLSLTSRYFKVFYNPILLCFMASNYSSRWPVIGGGTMAITDWPEMERPREKLLKCGAQALSDAELLAIFLRTGVAGSTAVDLARELLADFGSLRRLITASETEFCDRRGLGVAKFVQLQAVIEISRRHLRESIKRNDLCNDSSRVKRYLYAKLLDKPHEVFLGLFLDSQHRLIACEEMFNGTIDSAQIYPREVVKRVLYYNAAAVIFAHNHPSGVAEPSQADQQITHCLIEALALIDVKVLDHIVVGDQEIISMAERRML